jgi:hypothetical protein
MRGILDARTQDSGRVARGVQNDDVPGFILHPSALIPQKTPLSSPR